MTGKKSPPPSDGAAAPPDANVDEHIGARIRARRRILGLTQDDLATRVGVTAQQVHKYESGANRVAASKLFEIASVLSLPISAFFDGLTNAATDDADPAVKAANRLLLDKDVLELAMNFNDIGEERVRRMVLSIIKAATEAHNGQE